MIPIWLPFQIGAALEKLNGDLALQDPHQLGYRDLRGNRNQKMHMIILDIEPMHNSAQKIAKHIYIMVDKFF